MKLKSGFLLRNVAGKNIVVPVGAQLNFSGMLTLNDTATFLWNNLAEDISREELTTRLTKEYDIDRATAQEDINAFLTELERLDILEKAL